LPPIWFIRGLSGLLVGKGARIGSFLNRTYKDFVTEMSSPLVTNVLVLCTANLCRSPMAEALLHRLLAAVQPPVIVRSVGTLGSGGPPSAEVVSVMAGYGLDVVQHRSHLVTDADVAQADLILAMAREHVRHVVVMDPSSWPRAFTLKELLRRGQQTGPRMPGELLADWLSRVHHGRTHAALLGESPLDDVADPAGGPAHAYAGTAALLDQLVTRLVDLCWGTTCGSPAGAAVLPRCPGAARPRTPPESPAGAPGRSQGPGR
jgi:protein-tyrosine phosphatase